MKRNTLYKVNRWNKSAFGLDKNIFAIGAQMDTVGTKPNTSNVVIGLGQNSGPSIGSYGNRVDLSKARINSSIFQHQYYPIASTTTAKPASSDSNNQSGAVTTGLNTSGNNGIFNSISNLDWNKISSLISNIGSSSQAANTSQAGTTAATTAAASNASIPSGTTGAEGAGGKSGGGGSGWAAVGSAIGGTVLEMADKIPTGDKRGLWDTLDPGYNAGKTTFSDGTKGHYETGVGNVLSDIGVSLTKAGATGAMSGGGSASGYVALAGAAFKTLGNIINNGWGMATNTEALARAENEISDLEGFRSNADSFDDISDAPAMANIGDVYKGGVFRKGDAKEMSRDLRRRLSEARKFAGRSIENNINNLSEDQLNDYLSTWRAYGGPLMTFGSGALGIMQNDKYLDTIDRRSATLAGKQSVGGLQLPQQLAFGGELGTNGTDWTNGLLYIDNGGTHEENPFEGVPMGFDPEGVPNLVEEGETVYNDYVFSDRMKVPKSLMKELGLGGNMDKPISFADASKKFGKESEQRPNDPLSIAGLEASMSRLANIQEAERMKNEMREFVGLEGYACGGRLNKFAGTGNKSQKMKKGNTGLNTYKFDPIDQFKYWDKKAGDYDEGYRDFIENKLNNDWINRAMSGQYGDMSRYKGANNVNPTVEQAWQLGLDQKNSDWHKAMAAAYDDYLAGIDPVTGVATLSPAVPDETWELDPYSEGWEARRGISTEPIAAKAAQEGETDKGTEGTEVGGKKPKTYYTGLRYAPAIGAGIMSLTDALGLTNKPDYTMADRLEAAANAAGYAPNVTYDPIGDYLTYRPMDIWFEQNRLNANARATDRAILNSGANQGSKMAGLLAAGYNDQLASGNLYRQALEYNDAKRKDVADFNRRTNMFNSQMGLEAAMANARYRQQAQQLGISGLAQAAALRDSIDARVGAARAANLTNLFNSLGDIGRENMSLNMVNSTSAARNGYWIDKNGNVHYTGSVGSKYGGRIRKHK